MGKEQNQGARGGAVVQDASPGTEGGKSYVAEGFVDGEKVMLILNVDALGIPGNKSVELSIGTASPDGILKSTEKSYKAKSFADFNSVDTQIYHVSASRGLGAVPDMVSDVWESKNRRGIAYQAPALVAEFETAMLGGESPREVTPKELKNIITSFKRIDQSPDGIGAHAPQGKAPPAPTARGK